MKEELLIKKYGTERFSFDCPEEIIQKAIQAKCDQIGLKGEFYQDCPTQAYFEEIELGDNFIGLTHVQLQGGYSAACCGKVVWVPDF